MAPTTSIAEGSTNPNGKSHNKVVIIGSGPAGHTAAIYLARANLEPVMFEGMLANGFAPGGQLTTTTEVENLSDFSSPSDFHLSINHILGLSLAPGFPEGIRGPEMMDLFRAQSIRFGTKILTETVSKIDLSNRPFKYWREEHEAEEPETADSIIIATGASARRLNLPGEDTYWQSGISACAVCDGAVPIFRDKPLAVVGGGDSACEEATYLTKYASKVFVLVRRDQLRASKVTVLWNTVPVEAKGDGNLLNSLLVKDTKTGEERTIDINDEDGYICHQTCTSETSIPGVFAAGDVQDKKYRQAITSAGTGCIAALECERFLAEEEANDRDGNPSFHNLEERCALPREVLEFL
ncbi:hypothetical protein PSTT_05705 [Puccinia striiformis]|uniref:FAD/NAD(P)-binding domain-containing protein n=1 Tax=Puccinia striiformis TaxID=27350 RepID=A0A2S4VNG7_9BASI|nr:hypothetical protein PSTT_05705 [Puccinia striiformis]